MSPGLIARKSDSDWVWNDKTPHVETPVERFIGFFYSMCSPEIRKGRVLVQSRALTWWLMIVLPLMTGFWWFGGIYGFFVGGMCAVMFGCMVQFAYVTGEFSRLNLTSER